MSKTELICQSIDCIIYGTEKAQLMKHLILEKDPALRPNHSQHPSKKPHPSTNPKPQLQGAQNKSSNQQQ